MSSITASVLHFVRGIACALLLLVAPASAFAGGTTTPPVNDTLNTANGVGLADFKTSQATGTTVAGGGMLTNVGTTANQIANLLTGPILWIVMGAAVILAIYGFASGKMAMAFTGIGAFVLAAVLKGLFSLMKT